MKLRLLILASSTVFLHDDKLLYLFRDSYISPFENAIPDLRFFSVKIFNRFQVGMFSLILVYL